MFTGSCGQGRHRDRLTDDRYSLACPCLWIMYTDGVVQEPLTRGMRMDRDYRNSHARRMINRFI